MVCPEVENVVGDEEDIREMSQQLGCRPVHVCSGCLSWVRRPRLYWSNVALDQLNHHELYDVLEFNEELEPLGSVCDEGWFWPAAEVNKNPRLPTFTLPRRNPPKEPAGLQSCDRSTIDRWKEDRMKFPPYTYRPEFLFHHATGEEVKRVASATEREFDGIPHGVHLGSVSKGSRDGGGEEEADGGSRSGYRK